MPLFDTRRFIRFFVFDFAPFSLPFAVHVTCVQDAHRSGACSRLKIRADGAQEEQHLLHQCLFRT
jgi:hypothetical protein